MEKTKKVNEGEVPQYYVRGSHPAIIDPEYFDKVQAEIERRKKVGRRYTGISFLSSRVVCGDCGGFFGPKVWNSNSKYRRVIWQCNNKFKGEKCRTPHLDEKDIYRKFLQAYNLLLLNWKQLRRDCEEMLHFLTDNTNLEEELETLRNEQEVVAELTRKLVNENASTAKRQPDYYEKYTSFVDRYEEIGNQIIILEQKCAEREARAKEIRSYLNTIVSQSGELTQFDPRVWVEVVDLVTVFHDGQVVFRFKDGREIAT